MTSKTYTPKPISPGQQSFIHNLASERRGRLSGEQEVQIGEALAKDSGWTTREGSALIDELKAIQVERKSEPKSSTPEGKYALNLNGEVHFFEVDHGKAGGRWEGFTFLSRLAGENHEPVRNRHEKVTVLKAIDADVEGAARLYGTLTNSCGFCGMKLTDKFSRFYGVGPVCRDKHGMPKSEADFCRKGGTLPASYVDEGTIPNDPEPEEDESTPARRVIRVNEGEAVDLRTGQTILPAIERVELEAADAQTYEAAMELINKSRSLTQREKGKVARNEGDRRKARESAEFEVAMDPRFQDASPESRKDRIDRLTEKIHLQIQEGRES